MWVARLRGVLGLVGVLARQLVAVEAELVNVSKRSALLVEVDAGGLDVGRTQHAGALELLCVLRGGRPSSAKYSCLGGTDLEVRVGGRRDRVPGLLCVQLLHSVAGGRADSRNHENDHRDYRGEYAEEHLENGPLLLRVLLVAVRALRAGGLRLGLAVRAQLDRCGEGASRWLQRLRGIRHGLLRSGLPL